MIRRVLSAASLLAASSVIPCTLLAGCGGGGGGGSSSSPTPTPTPTPSASKSYTVTDLSAIPAITAVTGSQFGPNALTNTGVVGWYVSNSTVGNVQYATWNPATNQVQTYTVSGRVAKDDIVLLSSGGNTASALNESGQQLAQLVGPSNRAAIYPESSAISTAIVGYVLTTNGTSVFYQAVEWVASSSSSYSPQYLSTLPGYKGATASDINASGEIVGSCDLTELSEPHATLWKTGSSAPIDLGVLPGQTTSDGSEINDVGTVVGVSGNRGFIWTESGGISSLPPLAGDDTTTAVSIASNGDVSGISIHTVTSSDQSYRPVIWHNNSPSDMSGAAGSGWTVRSIIAMNSSGTLLVSAQNSQNGTHNLLLVPK